MNNQMLPHEFFIYVPSMQDISEVAHSCECDAERSGCTLCSQQPIDLSSWARIDLAESVAVYARLQQDQQELVNNLKCERIVPRNRLMSNFGEKVN